MRKLILISGLAIAATQLASADVFTIDRDSFGGTLCSAADPCGTVTVTGTSVLHVVTQLKSGFGIFSNKDAFGFSTVGSNTGVTLSNFSSNLFNGSGGSGNEGGWGGFEFRVDGPGGSSAVQTLSFDVTRFGNAFTSPADIEQGATGGNGSTIFGLHIRDMESGLTGYTGVTPQTATPEPASLALLGLGGIAVGVFRRRKKQS
ncbi:MAG TPA: PEP-CTERM sorting domain-containing protein [Bryobacteraceae bacterium]|jgi:hypothetical protein|nr:PEP-CTERM sorting domain-containing protein [Bryobacteraceae bacterium]